MQRCPGSQHPGACGEPGPVSATPLLPTQNLLDSLQLTHVGGEGPFRGSTCESTGLRSLGKEREHCTESPHSNSTRPVSCVTSGKSPVPSLSLGAVAGGPGLIPGWGTKIPQAKRYGKKKNLILRFFFFSIHYFQNFSKVIFNGFLKN